MKTKIDCLLNILKLKSVNIVVKILQINTVNQIKTFVRRCLFLNEINVLIISMLNRILLITAGISFIINNITVPILITCFFEPLEAQN